MPSRGLRLGGILAGTPTRSSGGTTNEPSRASVPRPKALWQDYLTWCEEQRIKCKSRTAWGRWMGARYERRRPVRGAPIEYLGVVL